MPAASRGRPKSSTACSPTSPPACASSRRTSACELFIREGKKLHLSPEGKLLLDYADRLLDLAHEAREAVHDAKPRGLLRLGSMESTASVRLPVPMNEYMSRYPEVTLELRTGTPRELATAVRDGRARRRAGGGTDRRCAVRKNPALRRGAGDHRRRRTIRRSSRRGSQWPHPCSPSRPAVPTASAWTIGSPSSGEMSDRIIEMSSYHAMLGCAVAGMGISMVPRMVLKTFPDVKLLSVHALPPEFSRAPTVLIWRKGRSRRRSGAPRNSDEARAQARARRRDAVQVAQGSFARAARSNGGG